MCHKVCIIIGWNNLVQCMDKGIKSGGGGKKVEIMTEYLCFVTWRKGLPLATAVYICRNFAEKQELSLKDYKVTKPLFCLDGKHTKKKKPTIDCHAYNCVTEQELLRWKFNLPWFVWALLRLWTSFSAKWLNVPLLMLSPILCISNGQYLGMWHVLPPPPPPAGFQK